MKDRASDEQKAESSKLKAVMERHKTLIPKIQETLVKTECYWKCYSYGDDLIPIFEFIDDLRNRSIREVISGNHEQTEEHMEKQDKVNKNKADSFTINIHILIVIMMVVIGIYH